MPIEWTEKKTTEERKQLRVAPVIRVLAMDGVTFASSDTHPATLDDLAAAIRGMREEDRCKLLDAAAEAGPCSGCQVACVEAQRELDAAKKNAQADEEDRQRVSSAVLDLLTALQSTTRSGTTLSAIAEIRTRALRAVAEKDEAQRDLVDARNALEIAKAEAERLRKELEALGKEHKAWMGEVESLNRERTELRAKLEARNQELDDQKAEIDRLKANQIPVEVEPEWVRRMPEWARKVLSDGLPWCSPHPHPGALNDVLRSANKSIHEIWEYSERNQRHFMLDGARDLAERGIRAACLARKAGGE